MHMSLSLISFCQRSLNSFPYAIYSSIFYAKVNRRMSLSRLAGRLSLDTSPVRSPSRGRVAVPLRKLVDLKSVLSSKLIDTSARRNKLELLAVVDDSWHDRDGSLVRRVVGSEVWLHRWRVGVVWGVDADGDVGSQTGASLAHIWVPKVELSDGEVGEGLGDGEAGVVWNDGVVGGAVGGPVDADLRDNDQYLD